MVWAHHGPCRNGGRYREKLFQALPCLRVRKKLDSGGSIGFDTRQLVRSIALDATALDGCVTDQGLELHWRHFGEPHFILSAYPQVKMVAITIPNRCSIV